MTKIACSLKKRSLANFVHTTVAPANRSEQARCGLLDSTVIAFFVLVCAAGLAFLLRQ